MTLAECFTPEVVANFVDVTSVNAVPKRSGISIGLILQYFPSKEGLIAELIGRKTALLISDAKNALSAPTGAGALSTMIAVAVAHQLRLPALARMLDFEEARLSFDEDTCQTRSQMMSLLLGAISRSDLPRQTNAEEAAQNVLAIIRGMVDAAGERGELDQDVVRCRAGRAVFGYLGARRSVSRLPQAHYCR